MLKKTKGIVIKRIPYGDHHLIVTFLSENGVKTTLMARNARKSNKYGAGLDLFYENIFIYSQFKGMGTLSSIDTIKSHYELRLDIEKLTYCQLICETIDKAIEEHDVSKFYFQLLQLGLDQLDQGIKPKLIGILVGLKCMPLYGFTPIFHWSMHENHGNQEKFVAYSIKYNSPITKQGLLDDEHAFKIQNRSLYFMHLLYHLPIEQEVNLNISDEYLKEMEHLMFLLYDEFIGVHLKSRQIIKQLNL